MEYLKFFELYREPFRNDPDPEFFFEGEGSKRARLRVIRAIEQGKGLAVVVGAAGCGKTTLATQIAWGLDPTRFRAEALVVSHRSCADGQLLPQIAERFGVRRVASAPVEQIEQIGDALLRVRAESRHPVLIVDEAQLLATPDVLRECRALLNLELGGRKLLTLALVGLSELDELLRTDEPLAQRVEARVELGPLSKDDATAYVTHRLKVARARRPLFEPEALQALCVLSGAVPRLLNTLADNALFEAYLNQAPRVDASLVAAAADQLALSGEPQQAAHEWIEPVASGLRAEEPSVRVRPIVRQARTAAPGPIPVAPEPDAIAVEHEDRDTLPSASPSEDVAVEEEAEFLVSELADDDDSGVEIEDEGDPGDELELREKPEPDLDHTQDSGFDLSSLIDTPDQPGSPGPARVEEKGEGAELDDLFAQIQLD